MKASSLEILADLEVIFQNIFDDDKLIINENMSSMDIDDWDSLAQINLILAIESTYQIRFTPTDIAPLRNIKDMIQLILLKLNHDK